MRISEPVVGLVVRYAFLWAPEADRGLREGAKARPAAIVLSKKAVDGEVQVVVAPITHSDPRGEPALRLPADVARGVGLDDPAFQVIW